MAHPLLAVLLAAANGVFPDPDGRAELLPPLEDGSTVVLALTAHSLVATHLTRADLADVPFDGYGGTVSPRTLLRLADGGSMGVHDVVLVAHGQGGNGTGSGPGLPATSRWDDHPRVRYARSMRHDVVVHGDERGFVTLGTGVAGRRELSIEVVSGLRGTGAGRALLGAALGAVPHGAPAFAVVSPGNARSLRAFLSQGFVPIGSEVLITRPGRPDPSQDRGIEAYDVDGDDVQRDDVAQD